MMQRALRPSALVSRGFDVESAVCAGTTTVISVRPTSGTGLCPDAEPVLCGSIADISDASPICRWRGGRSGLWSRRAASAATPFCAVDVFSLCGRRIFTERFDDGALAPWARRTARLDLVVHHLGLAWVAGQRRVLPPTYAARQQ